MVPLDEAPDKDGATVEAGFEGCTVTGDTVILLLDPAYRMIGLRVVNGMKSWLSYIGSRREFHRHLLVW